MMHNSRHDGINVCVCVRGACCMCYCRCSARLLLSWREHAVYPAGRQETRRSLSSAGLEPQDATVDQSASCVCVCARACVPIYMRLSWQFFLWALIYSQVKQVSRGRDTTFFVLFFPSGLLQHSLHCRLPLVCVVAGAGINCVWCVSCGRRRRHGLLFLVWTAPSPPVGRGGGSGQGLLFLVWTAPSSPVGRGGGCGGSTAAKLVDVAESILGVTRLLDWLSERRNMGKGGSGRCARRNITVQYCNTTGV